MPFIILLILNVLSPLFWSQGWWDNDESPCRWYRCVWHQDFWTGQKLFFAGAPTTFTAFVLICSNWDIKALSFHKLLQAVPSIGASELSPIEFLQNVGAFLRDRSLDSVGP